MHESQREKGTMRTLIYVLLGILVIVLIWFALTKFGVI